MYDWVRCFWVLTLASTFLHGQSTQILITQQPPGLVDAVARQRMDISITATGADLSYFWHRDGAFLPQGTNARLSLINIKTNDAGTYYVIVSNDVNTVRSSNVLLRVVPDTFGPRIVSAALLSGDSNRIYVSFDEDVLRSGAEGATNVEKFIVTDVATGERIPVTAAFPAVGLLHVRLTLATNLDRAKAYELCVLNVADTLTNYIALNSCVPIGWEVVTNCFGFISVWSVYCSSDPPPADWNTFAPIPTPPPSWCDGPGLFYGSFPWPDAPCTFPSTPLSTSPPYYFRKVFTVSTNLLEPPVTAVLGRVLPPFSGTSVYLNGAEILRTTDVFDEPVCWTNFIAVGHLLARTNVLAVKLAGDFFDASLTLRRTPLLTNRLFPDDVLLRHSNHSPSELCLFWTNGTGYALEYVNALGDQWRELQPPSTNLVIQKTVPARFYRLNKRH